MSLSGKITNICCRIDLRASLRTILYGMVIVLCCAKIQSVNFWPLQEVGYCCRQNAHVPFTAHCMYVITKEEKGPVSHPIVCDM